jgi:hypothetical protein
MTSPHKKVPDLPSADALTGAEILYLVQNGADKKILASQLVDVNPSFDEAVVTLVDGVTVPLNASEGNVFHLTALGSRTILTPSGAPAAGRTQKMIIRHFASGANRTLTLTVGSSGAFRFGTSITGLSSTQSGKTDMIGCIWNSLDSRWDVVAYAKGF